MVHSIQEKVSDTDTPQAEAPTLTQTAHGGGTVFLRAGTGDRKPRSPFDVRTPQRDVRLG